MHPSDQAFYRGSDRIIGGVCSGLAAGFHVDPLWVRLAFVLLAFVQGVGLFIYIVLWIVMPERVEDSAPRSGFDSMARDLKRVGREIQAQFGGLAGARSGSPASEPAGGEGAQPADAVSAPPPPVVRPRTGQPVTLGVVLLLLGVTLLAANTGLVTWAVVWPAALIIIGVIFLVRTLERRT